MNSVPLPLLPPPIFPRTRPHEADFRIILFHRHRLRRDRRSFLSRLGRRRSPAPPGLGSHPAHFAEARGPGRRSCRDRHESGNPARRGLHQRTATCFHHWLHQVLFCGAENFRRASTNGGAGDGRFHQRAPGVGGLAERRTHFHPRIQQHSGPRQSPSGPLGGPRLCRLSQRGGAVGHRCRDRHRHSGARAISPPTARPVPRHARPGCAPANARHRRWQPGCQRAERPDAGMSAHACQPCARIAIHPPHRRE